jgi:hypothetical protein
VDNRISDLLERISDAPGDRLTMRDLLHLFGERAFGGLMFVFAAPLILPMPPGLSAILGAPLVFITFQHMVGLPRLWLPRKLADQSIGRAEFVGFMAKILPRLRQMERLLRPRMTGLLAPVGQRLIGLVAFILAVIVFLPIPLGNMFPSLAIAALGLGLVEKDGLLALIGWLTAVASLLVLAFVSRALLAATGTFFQVLFSPFF